MGSVDTRAPACTFQASSQRRWGVRLLRWRGSWLRRLSMAQYKQRRLPPYVSCAAGPGWSSGTSFWPRRFLTRFVPQQQRSMRDLRGSCALDHNGRMQTSIASFSAIQPLLVMVPSTAGPRVWQRWSYSLQGGQRVTHACSCSVACIRLINSCCPGIADPGICL
jgi:hypothetical protein